MGIVVALPKPTGQRKAVAQSDAATILLFMGVRYVRDLEPDVADKDATESRSDEEIELQPLEIA